MQAVLKFAVVRDEDQSVVLDEEPSAFDQERWRRRLPVIGETVTIGAHRGRVLSRTSREVMSEDGSGNITTEIEVLIVPEDD